MLSDIKTAYDLGKEGIALIKKIKDRTKSSDPIYGDLDKVYNLISDMKDAINELKDNYFESSINSEKMRKELDSLKEWSKQQSSYEKKMISPGAQVLIDKNEACDNENVKTWYCPGCFANKKIGVFQFKQKFGGVQFIYECTNCKGEIRVFMDIHSKRVQE